MSVKIDIPLEELQKRKLMVGTPMYAGACQGLYTKSIADLSALCVKNGIELRLYFLFNESLITRARNYVSDEFMRSDCTHLMFIDSDIGFNPTDVLAMLAMQSEDSEYDILCGPYPKKCISWEKIVTAVNKGFGDEDPNQLEKFVGDYVFNPANGTTSFGIHDPVEILESGTGFMMIKKSVFTKFADAYPQQLYTPDHVRTEHFDGSRQIVAYFDTPICKETNRYLSEDYMFCAWSRKAGMKIWLCPWIKLTHTGMMIFGGSLEDLAKIGASPTADPSLIKRK